MGGGAAMSRPAARAVALMLACLAAPAPARSQDELVLSAAPRPVGDAASAVAASTSPAGVSAAAPGPLAAVAQPSIRVGILPGVTRASIGAAGSR